MDKIRLSILLIQKNFSGSKTDDSFTTAVSNSFLTLLEKNPIAADFGYFRVFFFFILKMVYYVYSLELPR